MESLETESDYYRRKPNVNVLYATAVLPWNCSSFAYDTYLFFTLVFFFFSHFVLRREATACKHELLFLKFSFDIAFVLQAYSLVDKHVGIRWPMALISIQAHLKALEFIQWTEWNYWKLPAVYPQTNYQLRLLLLIYIPGKRYIKHTFLALPDILCAEHNSNVIARRTDAFDTFTGTSEYFTSTGCPVPWGPPHYTKPGNSMVIAFRKRATVPYTTVIATVK